MNNIEKDLLEHIEMSKIDKKGAYNIRINGELDSRNNSENVTITSKIDNPGIDIFVKENSEEEIINIPVLVTTSGIKDLVYNDFYIGENATITILAGCAIHNNCDNDTQHNGIHTFHLEKNAKVKYIEKHYGCGTYEQRTINTDTIIFLKENSSLNIETVQIGGLDHSIRTTKATIQDNASLVINEKIITTDLQEAKTLFDVDLDGYDSAVQVSSRSIAKNNSKQEFTSNIKGNNKSFGHVECDAIIMDNAKVSSTPKIIANNPETSLIHEAAIGKIAKEQITKLMTLGLTEQEAENEIINGFIK